MEEDRVPDNAVDEKKNTPCAMEDWHPKRNRNSIEQTRRDHLGIINRRHPPLPASGNAEQQTQKGTCVSVTSRYDWGWFGLTGMPQSLSKLRATIH